MPVSDHKMDYILKLDYKMTSSTPASPLIVQYFKYFIQRLLERPNDCTALKALTHAGFIGLVPNLKRCLTRFSLVVVCNLIFLDFCGCLEDTAR